MAVQIKDLSGLTAQMSRLKVGQTPSPAVVAANVFPARPAFATRGREVVVWANYFRINVKPEITFYKYTLTASQPPKGGAEDTEKKGPGKKAQPREVKGRKLYMAIQAALDILKREHGDVNMMTEYKSQLVTTRKIDIDNKVVRVELPVASNPEKSDIIELTFYGPNEVSMDNLSQYLQSMKDAPGDELTFPRYPTAVDALNVMFGSGPRSKLDEISTIGGNRFFPFGREAVIRELSENQHALIGARGFVQSARLGTGRMLLNTNVTHAVFKISGKMSEIMDKLGILVVPKSDGRGNRKLKAFAKFLPKTRVMVTYNLGNGKQVTRPKTIHNLAMSWDRRGRTENPPTYQPGYEFGGPKNVKFWLEGTEKGSGEYTTVFDYFKKSKSRSCLSSSQTSANQYQNTT